MTENELSYAIIGAAIAGFVYPMIAGEPETKATVKAAAAA